MYVVRMRQFCNYCGASWHWSMLKSVDSIQLNQSIGQGVSVSTGRCSTATTWCQLPTAAWWERAAEWVSSSAKPTTTTSGVVVGSIPTIASITEVFMVGIYGAVLPNAIHFIVVAIGNTLPIVAMAAFSVSAVSVIIVCVNIFIFIVLINIAMTVLGTIVIVVAYLRSMQNCAICA